MLKKALFSLVIGAASVVSSYQASALVKACTVVYDIDTTKFFGLNLNISGHGVITCEDLLGHITSHALHVGVAGITPGLSFGHCHTHGEFKLAGTSIDAGFDWPAALTQFGGAAVSLLGRTGEIGISASLRDAGVKVTVGYSKTTNDKHCLDLFRVGGEAISFVHVKSECTECAHPHIHAGCSHSHGAIPEGTTCGTVPAPVKQAPVVQAPVQQDVPVQQAPVVQAPVQQDVPAPVQQDVPVQQQM